MGAASKAKGSSHERAVCKQLSLWVTHGKKTDCFWRSAMSGGRATVARKRGKDVRQAGDITAVAPEGHALMDRVFIECKHYKDLNIPGFLLTNKGTLANFWRTVCKEAQSRGRLPWLVARENNRPTMLITGVTAQFFMADTLTAVRPASILPHASIWLFDKVLQATPPKEFTCPILPTHPTSRTSPSLSLTGTALCTGMTPVGRVRL